MTERTRAALPVHNNGLSVHTEQGGHVDKVKACVDKLVSTGRDQGVDFAIACGGGRAMDCGKAVAREFGVPLVVVPTIAGTNAATTISSGIEGDDVPRRLDEMNARRIDRAHGLTRRLEAIPELTLPSCPPDCTHVYYGYTVMAPPDWAGDRRDRG